MTLALSASAQQVRFPTATQPLAAAPLTTFAAPPPTNSAFAAPPVSPPLYSSPPAYGSAIGTPAPVTTPPSIYTPPATTLPTTTPPPITPTYPSTTAPGVSPFTSPTTVPPAPGLSTPAPSLAPGTVSPPPPFDPYSTTAPLGAPPAAVPYNTTPPPPGAPATSPLYPNGMPYQFQAPSTEGYYATTQKLLQELSAEFTWLYGKQTDPKDLGITRLELSTTLAFPMMYNIETPLLVTPGFAFNWLQGPLSNPADVPRGPDLPPRLYDAYLDFGWYPRVNQWLGGELGVRVGVYSDFDHVTDESVRILGRGLASVSTTPNLDILFGVVYLDRLKIKILPAGGVYWRPTPEWDAYLVFPNPKVRKYWANTGNTKWYWYAAGEYGGGSWTVDRPAAGANPELGDQIDINDIRVIGGVEFETQAQIRGHFEVGYVWDREILFRSGQPGPFGLDDTVMLRAGVDF
ncbi:MAG: hypothetical protein AB7G28_11765 [Pirellulales bacterium]